jgi:hypothetical protein
MPLTSSGRQAFRLQPGNCPVSWMYGRQYALLCGQLRSHFVSVLVGVEVGKHMHDVAVQPDDGGANRCNPCASALLLGETPSEYDRAVSPIQFVCADAADFRENTPAVFDAFALSNMSDGASLAYQRRLRTAVERAATPGAVLVTLSFAEPGSDTAANLAALDAGARSDAGDFNARRLGSVWDSAPETKGWMTCEHHL